MKPVLLTVDDDTQVVRAIERDLKQQMVNALAFLKQNLAKRLLNWSKS
jgi:hypothetical protein